MNCSDNEVIGEAFLKKYIEADNSRYISEMIQVESDKQLANLVELGIDSSNKKKEKNLIGTVKKAKSTSTNFKYIETPKKKRKQKVDITTKQNIQNSDSNIKKIEDVKGLDNNISKLTMDNRKEQPEENIGIVGMVSEGKSTGTLAVTGQATQRSKKEMERNITMKIGYADTKIWQKDGIFVSKGFNSNLIDEVGDDDLVNHISIVDCPGHMDLISMMISSVRLMNAVIVVVSAEGELSKKVSLIQHLRAVKLSGIKNIIVCLNKIDLIRDDKEKIKNKYNELKKFLEDMEIDISHPIIPTVFQQKIGTDLLLNAIKNACGTEKEDEDDKYFLSNRSFVVNKPGSNYEKVVGACIGGSLIGGELCVGDEIEVKPGLGGVKDKDGNLIPYTPIRTRIESLRYGNINLNKIVPGGLISIGTGLVPSIGADDFLAGKLVGKVGSLPGVYKKLCVSNIVTNIFGFEWTPSLEGNQKKVSIQFENQIVRSLLKNINNEDGKDTEYVFDLEKPMCIREDKRVIFIKPKGNEILAYGTFVKGEGELEND